ncbi:GNAT family N-acetyltransferase [Vibrio harveyi]|uniref:GNAT family N-acetyltransferase n=1 Tax=Vibrio harveyi TaxID=669 RepID=UPI0025AFB9FB|nr:GNAT family N-acetyltransferase [Vibrio harveyi]WJT10315.1 GNAT family N-acetyltransferase [Vibrio harveyi]
MIEIVKAQTNDIIQVADLVSKVTQRHILEHFTEEGKRRFLARIGQDVTQAITHPDFFALAAFRDNKVVGFAALKDDNYLTHLFVATEAQSHGLGKQLLDTILDSTHDKPRSYVRLRSAPNAVSFYHKHGFEPTDDLCEKEGIRYVPMRLALVSSLEIQKSQQ